MARLADQAERYEDMVEYMKRVAQMGTGLSADERNLLSVAYKNCVAAQRAAWRSMAYEISTCQDPAVLALAQNYSSKIEEELHGRCSDILDLLARVLIPGASDGESRVFYIKMKGDYYRYLSEQTASDKRTEWAGLASEAYEAATQVASAEMDPAHPIALGLALNYSVFFNEVYGETMKASTMAQTAFKNAEPRLAGLTGEQQADSAQIMALIQQNVELWGATLQEGGGPANDMQAEDL